MKGLHLHIDCPSGVAGDMFVGAALDLGVPREVIDQAVALLGEPIRWTLTSESRGGIVGKKVRVVDEHGKAVDAHEHDDDHDHDHHSHHHHHPDHSTRAKADHNHRPYRD